MTRMNPEEHLISHLVSTKSRITNVTYGPWPPEHAEDGHVFIWREAMLPIFEDELNGQSTED